MIKIYTSTYILQIIHKSPNVTNIEYVQMFNIYKMSLMFNIYKQYTNANPPVPCLTVTVYDASYDSKRPSHDDRVGEVIDTVMMWHPVRTRHRSRGTLSQPPLYERRHDEEMTRART